MTKTYSRLQFKVHDPLKIQDLTFKFIVINNATKKVVFAEKGSFDSKGFTKWFFIFQPNRSLRYEIYYGEEMIQAVSAKSYPQPNKWSLFDFKTTAELTKKIKENIKEIYLDDGEIAWYLIKKRETVGGWASRVFKKPLLPSDWDILRTNNPHLSNLVSMGVLEPGQVVVLSNSTTTKKLADYKKLAKQANQKLEEMKKDKNFDAAFFAQNYEFFYDAIESKKAKIVGKDILEKEDNLPVKLKEQNEGFFEQKMAVDATVTLAEGQAHKVYKVHAELAEKLAEEKAKGSPLAHPKNFKLFKREYASLFSQIENESTQKFFRWDQSIKTNNMRRILSQSALVRDKNYKGGIKDYAKKMGEIGEFSKKLKLVGYVALASDVLNAGIEINKAKPEDKARTTVVETTKVGTGILTGAFTSALIIGLATGGTGLVVIGVVAISAAMAGKATGDIAGWVAGETYDAISEYQSK